VPIASVADSVRHALSVLDRLLLCQAPFYGMHPGQLLHLKLTWPTSELLLLPLSTPAAIAELCLECWAEEPAARPADDCRAGAHQ